MTNTQVKLIAEMLTGHPDVFTETMGGQITSSSVTTGPPTTIDKPLNATEIRKQAQDIGGNDEADDLIAGQLKDQQDIQRQQEQEKQKILQPQFDKLNSTMANMQNGVVQGKQTIANGDQQFGSLEKEMASLNTLLSGIQKQV